MSIKVSSFVWDNSQASEGALLVLLAIADFAHDDGTGAWPTVATLGRKARLSERGVQYAIRRLEELGELVVGYKAGPGGRNLYRVILTAMEGRNPLHPAETAPRNPLHLGGEADCTTEVQPTAPITVNEPPVQPSELLTPPSSADEVVEGEFVEEKPRTAQTLVARWIDSRDEKPVGRVVGQVSKLLKEMLDEGIAYERVEMGLVTWSRSGYGASALPSFVDNAGKTPRSSNQQQETDNKFARAFARAQAGQNVFASNTRELTA